MNFWAWLDNTQAAVSDTAPKIWPPVAYCVGAPYAVFYYFVSTFDTDVKRFKPLQPAMTRQTGDSMLLLCYYLLLHHVCY